MNVNSYPLIERHNTLIDGYVPVLREIEGVSYLVQGAYNLAFGLMAPITSEGLIQRGTAQILDGAINLAPITILGIGILIGKNL